MKQTQGKIGIKEYFAIVAFMIGAKIADDTPSLFYNQLDNAAWMAPLINGLVTIIPIMLFLKVMSMYQGMNLAEVTLHLLGGVLGKIVLFVLWMMLSIGIVLDASVYKDIITSIYFPRTSNFLVIALLIGVCTYIGKKGIEQIGSISWALFPYVVVFFILALILSIIQGVFGFLFPLFGPGEWTIVKDSVVKGSVFADFMYILLIAPAVKSFKDFKKGTWIAFIFITIQAAVALASYVILFDYKSVKMMAYPFHESIFYVELGFLSDVEILIFPFWLIAVFIRFAFYLYLSSMLLGSIFNIKNYKFIVPAFATLVLFSEMTLPTAEVLIHLREMQLLTATPVFFFLPVLLFVIAKWRGEKHASNNGLQ